MPSSGMQYVHRKLQRSVTEMRRSRCTRPNVSTSGVTIRTRLPADRPGAWRPPQPPARRRRRRAARPGALAAAMAASWCEPCPPDDRTWHRPSEPNEATDPHEVRLAVGPAPEAVVGDRREPGPVDGARAPSSCATPAGRRARRTPCDDTGLPGSPNTGTPPHRAERERLGRLDGDLHPRHVAADAVEDDLHVVEVAHAHAAAGEDGVARRPRPARGRPRWRRRRRRSTRGRRRRTRTPPRRASSDGRFESRICPGARGPGPSTSSSPVDITPTRGRGNTVTDGRARRWPARRGGPAPAPRPGRPPRRRAGGRRRRDGCGRRPPRLDRRCGPGRRPPAPCARPSRSASAPSGIGRAGHDPDRLARPDRDGRRRAGRQRADRRRAPPARRPCRRPAPRTRPSPCSRTAGSARCHHRLGHHEPERGRQRDRHGRERVDRAEHPSPRLVQGHHAADRRC